MDSVAVARMLSCLVSMESLSRSERSRPRASRLKYEECSFAPGIEQPREGAPEFAQSLVYSQFWPVQDARAPPSLRQSVVGASFFSCTDRAVRPPLFIPAVVQQPALALRRMRTQAFLVRLGAPTRTIGNDHVAVDIFGHVREQLVVPGQAIDVGLHDAQIRHCGAEMRAHHAAEMAVEIMRG